MLVTGLFNNEAAVLGMNNRNVSYTRPYNLRLSRKLADNKLKTKRILKKFELPVPKTYAIIRNKHELDTFDWSKLPKSFVLKPNRGTHGRGILVAYGKSKKTGDWIGNEGKRINIEDLKSHIIEILEGSFSLRTTPDKAFFEERIKSHTSLKPFFFKGLPDVRVIVFNKVPVMAAIRLPTRRSEGKGNVHAGAMYVGLDMATGVSTFAVIRKPYSLIKDSYSIIENTVDPPYIPLRGIRIPKWTKVLQIAVQSHIATGLGYAGVDVAIDREKGPIIMELNARPGLAIQHANLEGLLGRLKRVSGLRIKTAARGVAVAKSLFGGEIEEEIESLSGKQVLGRTERVILLGLPYQKKTRKRKKLKTVRKKIVVRAKIDTGATRTSVDEGLMRKLGYSDAIDYFNSFNYPVFDSLEEAKRVSKERDDAIISGLVKEHPMIKSRSLVKSGTGITIRPILPVKLVISGTKISTEVTVIDRSDLEYKMIIGLKDLKQFLIDPTKRSVGKKSPKNN